MVLALCCSWPGSCSLLLDARTPSPGPFCRDASSLFALGRLYERLDRHADAVRVYKEHVEERTAAGDTHARTVAEALVLLATRALHDGQLQEAEQYALMVLPLPHPTVVQAASTLLHAIRVQNAAQARPSSTNIQQQALGALPIGAAVRMQGVPPALSPALSLSRSMGRSSDMGASRSGMSMSGLSASAVSQASLDMSVGSPVVR